MEMNPETEDDGHLQARPITRRMTFEPALGARDAKCPCETVERCGMTRVPKHALFNTPDGGSCWDAKLAVAAACGDRSSAFHRDTPDRRSSSTEQAFSFRETQLYVLLQHSIGGTPRPRNGLSGNALSLELRVWVRNKDLHVKSLTYIWVLPTVARFRRQL